MGKRNILLCVRDRKQVAAIIVILLNSSVAEFNTKANR